MSIRFLLCFSIACVTLPAMLSAQPLSAQPLSAQPLSVQPLSAQAALPFITGEVPLPAHARRARGASDGISNILFVNDCKPGGCVVHAGDFNDARANVSTVPSFDSLLRPFEHDQEIWDQTIECLREVYGPYNVEIVTEDPGTLDHHEAILAGSPGDMGLGNNIGGIVADFGCTPEDNVMSFSFSEILGPNVLNLCAVVAQESAHAYGLDHSFNCEDPMTYLGGCGQKFFRNKNAECGEFEPRMCECASPTQNTHGVLVSLFGPGTPPPPPTLGILSPSDGATVSDNFSVIMNASDPRLVDRIDVYINDWLYETIAGHDFDSRDDPYVYTTTDDLAQGVMNIEIVAYNDLDVSTSTSLTVTRGAPCVDDDACLDGQECTDGGCYWLPPAGVLGDACARDMECVSLLCPDDIGDGTIRVCSQNCTPNVQGQCPATYDCLPRADDPAVGLCWPEPKPPSTGCRTAATAPSTGVIALACILCAMFVRRRRGRSAEHSRDG